jgi:hypothetical protein
MPSAISTTSYKNANLNSRQFEARIAEIRGDGMLSDQGKLGELQAEYDRAAAVAAQIETERVQQINSRRTTLEQARLALRPGEAANSSTVIAFRDSQDRADALKDQPEALRALDRAERSGDSLQARAILAAAFEPERLWADVVNAYEAKHPEAVADLEELWDITLEDGPTGRVASSEMMRLLTQPISIRKPAELGGGLL